MSNIAKITRLAVFVDHDNFVSHYCALHSLKPESVSVWDGLSAGLKEGWIWVGHPADI